MKAESKMAAVQVSLVSICSAFAALIGCSSIDPVFDNSALYESNSDDMADAVVEESEIDGEVHYTEDRELCRDRNPQRNLYFGDLHAHTRYSLDAYLFKNRKYPLDAYLFARGEELKVLTHTRGKKNAVTARLDKPLDFAAITDHSEFLGELATCLNPQSPTYGVDLCKALRGEISGEDIWENQTVKPNPKRYEEVCGSDYSICLQGLDATWESIKEMANLAYDRTEECSFTAFIGYEYTGAPGGAILHRNVIFRNSNVIDRPFSYYEQNTLPGLWRALEEECLEAGTGCDVIAVPHNSNMSWGNAFNLAYPEDLDLHGQKELAALRVRLEPLVEIYQHKGSSECFSIFSADEACGFENRDYWPCNGDGSGYGLVCAAKADYLRHFLASGLGELERIGVNPFKLGIVASTDTHNAFPGNVREEGFVGHAGTKDIDILKKLSDGLEFSPGGIAGVWAVENSRDALFEALKRREVFGTSGPRISVRFFGGWDFEPEVCQDGDLVTRGYQDGVPMGAGLPGRPPYRHAPVFVVKAQKDENPLQKLEIIKVWLDEAGEPQEQVFDVAGDFSESATVDIETCETQGQGFSSLCARWADPEFDPEIPSAYYARVLEIPTCRWSAYACNSLPENEWPEACDEPGTIRERAWTSPIWYEP